MRSKMRRPRRPSEEGESTPARRQHTPPSPSPRDGDADRCLGCSVSQARTPLLPPAGRLPSKRREPSVDVRPTTVMVTPTLTPICLAPLEMAPVASTHALVLRSPSSCSRQSARVRMRRVRSEERAAAAGRPPSFVKPTVSGRRSLMMDRCRSSCVESLPHFGFAVLSPARSVQGRSLSSVPVAPWPCGGALSFFPSFFS